MTRTFKVTEKLPEKSLKILETWSPRNGSVAIAGGARCCARLQGCTQVHALRLSFETLAEFIIRPRVARTRWQALRTTSKICFHKSLWRPFARGHPRQREISQQHRGFKCSQLHA